MIPKEEMKFAQAHLFLDPALEPLCLRFLSDFEAPTKDFPVIEFWVGIMGADCLQLREKKSQFFQQKNEEKKRMKASLQR